MNNNISQPETSQKFSETEQELYDAFIDEYLKLKEIGGPKDPNNYNVIESPGKKIEKVLRR